MVVPSALLFRELRRRGVKYSLPFAGALGVAALGWNTFPLVDSLRFKAFEIACRSATEQVFATTSTTELEIDYWPYSGVMEDDYYPFHLAERLLTGQPRIASVYLAYEMPRDKVVEASCAGKYVMVGSSVEQLRRAFPACGKHIPYESIQRPRYAVRYYYEAPNFLSVRSFRVAIEDTQSGKVLAEQRSHQLLLGNMNERTNARWYGWGSAQGAKVCKLTSPKDFILNVIGRRNDG
jgi:hypothetical protein